MIDTTSVDLLSLIGADVRLKKVAATHGGEWAGPCPFCGGVQKRDADRFHVWPAEGRYWCRRCERKGDAIDYVRQRHGLGFGAALDRLGLENGSRHEAAEATCRSGLENTENMKREAVALEQTGQGAGLRRPEATGSARLPGSLALHAPRLEPPEALTPGAKARGREDALPLPLREPLEPPSDAWQGRAIDFCSECIDRLWTEEGARVRAWLIEQARLQPNRRSWMPAWVTTLRSGMRRPPYGGSGADHKPIWLPAGVTIPWAAGGHTWRVSIRRPEGTPKYVVAGGSGNALYRVATIAPGWAAVLVEGEFDALTIWQHAGGIIASVATGSTTGARRPCWQTRLASCDVVLVAFDSDKAGEEAAAYWLNILPKARRWRPYFGKDANGLAVAGGDVAAWILDGLGSAPW